MLILRYSNHVIKYTTHSLRNLWRPLNKLSGSTINLLLLRSLDSYKKKDIVKERQMVKKLHVFSILLETIGHTVYSGLSDNYCCSEYSKVDGVLVGYHRTYMSTIFGKSVNTPAATMSKSFLNSDL